MRRHLVDHRQGCVVGQHFFHPASRRDAHLPVVGCDEDQYSVVLLLAPAGGDELQGVKRGIMEMADLILVNKADGDLLPAAIRTCADYAGALRLLRKRSQDPEGFPKAMTVSAVEGRGLSEAWAEIETLTIWRRDTGVFATRRAEQSRHWFEEEVRQGLLARLTADSTVRHRMQKLGAEVEAGLSPTEAARRMLASLGPS